MLRPSEASEAFTGQDGDHQFSSGQLGELGIGGGEVLGFESDDQRVGWGQ